MLEFVKIVYFAFNVKNFNINNHINDQLIETTKNYTSNYVEQVYKPLGSYFLKSIAF
jgi:hypothetical protein